MTHLQMIFAILPAMQWALCIVFGKVWWTRAHVVLDHLLWVGNQTSKSLFGYGIRRVWCEGKYDNDGHEGIHYYHHVTLLNQVVYLDIVQ